MLFRSIRFGFTTPVTVLSDLASGGSDEGRAMLEIVHDVAPGAQLYYYSAFNGDADFAAGIRALADAGCKVIVDDISYFNEPYFQDGIIAQAVDYAVNVKGANYFSSAANSSDQSYEAPYKASTFQPFGAGNPETAHNFGTAANPIYYLPINGSARPVVFQWDEPFLAAGNGSPGSASDLNIYILTYNSTTMTYTVVAQSTTNNIGSDPIETFGFANVNLANRYILITKKTGPDPTRIKVIGNRNITWTLTPSTIAGIRAGTCIGHANAAGAIACGAASYDKTPAFGVAPPQIESYSSKGGTPILFTPAGVRLASPDDRRKPEIVAPDNANTSFFVSGYDYEPDGKPNFPGTSAAAPHAAAVAALMRQGNPTLTPAAVKTALINSCVDMDDPNTTGFDTGFDYRTGAGLIRADVAVQATLNPNCPPTVVTITRPTTFCEGDSVIFNANTGTGFTFQWKKDGISLGSGATSAQYIAKTSGRYSVDITRVDCTLPSDEITVTRNPGVPLPTTISRSVPFGTTITAGNGLQASSTCYTLTPQTATYAGGTVGYDGNLSSGPDPTAIFSGLTGNVVKAKVSITWKKRPGNDQNSCGTAETSGRPYFEELSFRVKAPDNTIINLLSSSTYATGASGLPFSVTTVFEDGSPVVGTTPASGTYSPAQTLAALAGKIPNGTWTLLPNDNGGGDPLCVSGFSITLSTDGATTPSTNITWWDAASGGSQVASTPEYIPTNTAVGSYTYYAQAGCSNGLTCNTSIRKPATLTITPVACTPPTGATAGSNSPVTVGSPINLTSSSTGGTSQVWASPSGFTSSLQNPTIASATTAMAGVYTVTITSSGTCTATATTNVVVNAAPTSCITPTATASSNSPVCAGTPLNLMATCTGSISATLSGASQVPANASTATGSVTGTFNSVTNLLSVNVTFNGLSAAATAGHIHSGAAGVNGGVIVPFSGFPSAVSGTYSNSYTLTASQATALASNGLYVNIHSSTFPGGEIRGQIALSTCTFAWTGVNGFSSTDQNPSIPSATLAATGTYQVIVTNAGCTAMATTSVTVNPVPTGVTAGSNSPVTVGSPINLTSSSSGGVSQVWAGPNSYASTLQNPTIASATVAMVGVYTVIVNSISNCTATATTIVVVNAVPTVCSPPTAATAGSNSPVTVGSPINLTSSSTGGTSQVWASPSGFTSTLQNPTIASATTAMAGVYTVTITSSGTCTATATTSVVIVIPTTTGIVFVNIANASPTQDGISWATAYSNLQTALSAAPANSEFWIAQGTYKPTVNINRTIAFNIPSGAKLYGGFVGTEVAQTQRNFNLNPTILSGEIDRKSTRLNSSHRNTSRMPSSA